MNHIKKIILDNGDKINIYISFYEDGIKAVYNTSIAICKKGKRKFFNLSFDDYEYRGLSMPERRVYEYSKILEIVDVKYIREAKYELYELLRP